MTDALYSVPHAPLFSEEHCRSRGTRRDAQEQHISSAAVSGPCSERRASGAARECADAQRRVHSGVRSQRREAGGQPKPSVKFALIAELTSGRRLSWATLSRRTVASRDRPVAVGCTRLGTSTVRAGVERRARSLHLGSTGDRLRNARHGDRTVWRVLATRQRRHRRVAGAGARLRARRDYRVRDFNDSRRSKRAAPPTRCSSANEFEGRARAARDVENMSRLCDGKSARGRAAALGAPRVLFANADTSTATRGGERESLSCAPPSAAGREPESTGATARSPSVALVEIVRGRRGARRRWRLRMLHAGAEDYSRSSRSSRSPRSTSSLRTRFTAWLARRGDRPPRARRAGARTGQRRCRALTADAREVARCRGRGRAAVHRRSTPRAPTRCVVRALEKEIGAWAPPRTTTPPALETPFQRPVYAPSVRLPGERTRAKEVTESAGRRSVSAAPRRRQCAAARAAVRARRARSAPSIEVAAAQATLAATWAPRRPSRRRFHRQHAAAFTPAARSAVPRRCLRPGRRARRSSLKPDGAASCAADRRSRPRARRRIAPQTVRRGGCAGGRVERPWHALRFVVNRRRQEPERRRCSSRSQVILARYRRPVPRDLAEHVPEDDDARLRAGDVQALRRSSPARAAGRGEQRRRSPVDDGRRRRAARCCSTATARRRSSTGGSAFGLPATPHTHTRAAGAAREVLEEVGFDIAGLLDADAFIEVEPIGYRAARLGDRRRRRRGHPLERAPARSEISGTSRFALAG